MALLEISGIRKSFGKTEVLKGIDFSMEKGEIISIIGSSGSGKTTLLRCINFLERPDEGRITLGGETLLDASDPARISERELRRRRLHFGLVFQSFNLFPQHSVLRNVTLACELEAMERLRAQKASKAERAAAMEDIRSRATGLLESVGLGEKLQSYPCQLSGGQQQRVAIARALALNPEILCFDEPTSALDPELTGEVLKVIRSLKSQNRTMIIVTHEMEFAHSISDRIIFMDGGVIAAQGTPHEMFDEFRSERLAAFIKNFTDLRAGTPEND